MGQEKGKIGKRKKKSGSSGRLSAARPFGAYGAYFDIKNEDIGTNNTY